SGLALPGDATVGRSAFSRPPWRWEPEPRPTLCVGTPCGVHRPLVYRRRVRRGSLELRTVLGDKALAGHRPVAAGFGELVAQHRAPLQQLAKARVAAHAGGELPAHRTGVAAHVLGVFGAHAQVIDQGASIHGEAAIDDIRADGARGVLVAVARDALQVADQLFLAG